MAGQSVAPRRRFLLLRIVFFLLSLPILYWLLTRYGAQLWSYAQSYPGLHGFWLWFWTALIVLATWGMWRRLRRKWSKARALVAEIDDRVR